MAGTIGIRELRDHLSATLARVRAGEVVTVTDRDDAIALIVPLRGSREERLRALRASGLISGGTGKPLGLATPAIIGGPTVADAVIEDRR